MVAELAFLFLAASGPKPTDGPALALPCLSRFELKQAARGQDWTNGVYSVSFMYKSHLPKQKVCEIIAKSIPNAPKPPKGDASGYSCTRVSGGVIQQISVWYMGDWTNAEYDKKHGTKHVRLTSISVTEMSDPWSLTPARWYKNAISSKSPAPEFSLPFQAKVFNQTIAIASLTQLCSSRGTLQPGTDAVSYTLYVDEPYRAVSKRADSYFIGNGYAKNRFGAYYKQTKGAFDYYLYPAGSRTAPKCVIQVTTTKKLPPGPVYRGPIA